MEIQAAVSASLTQPEPSSTADNAEIQDAVTASLAQPEPKPAPAARKTKTSSKKGKAVKGKGKEAKVRESQNESSCVMKDITDTSQSGAKDYRSEVVKTPQGKKAEAVEPELTGRRSRR